MGKRLTPEQAAESRARRLEYQREWRRRNRAKCREYRRNWLRNKAYREFLTEYSGFTGGEKGGL